ncbi:CLUMA_CG001057, isoform A [Clunio marinus]|uniref:CLUMA_CG001057, isoform A n=1 Tax=Clunio marinus TaxID=568069 RepID=A0A1J1HGW5_9DIPT|nr:CLUMA_CG001057, isoform A [Clunio marinus]
MLPHLCNEHPYTSLDMLFRWAVYYESRCLFSQVDVKAVEVVGNYFRVVPLDGRDRPALTVAVHQILNQVHRRIHQPHHSRESGIYVKPHNNVTTITTKSSTDMRLTSPIDICHSFEKKDLASRYECKNLYQRFWVRMPRNGDDGESRDKVSQLTKASRKSKLKYPEGLGKPRKRANKYPGSQAKQAS